ncbi:helix-turn-helix domain-containing protein [Acutalibacter sp.]|uniref:helix-turn-helix domain-containing protein n=1 Tax=Acutalibacter sp. TaxID=1918636 RepID=UPI00216DCB15|nr:helix-turn-helix domain-containing protein [Acutalibacter sp.]
MDILRGKMVEKRINAEELSRKIGIDQSTFYRKMSSQGENFTVGQMHKIVDVLQLTRKEATSIFLW